MAPLVAFGGRRAEQPTYVASLQHGRVIEARCVRRNSRQCIMLPGLPEAKVAAPWQLLDGGGSGPLLPHAAASNGALAAGAAVLLRSQTASPAALDQQLGSFSSWLPERPGQHLTGDFPSPPPFCWHRLSLLCTSPPGLTLS